MPASADEAPPPMSDEERTATESLLRRVDEAVENLRREAQGLENAREWFGIAVIERQDKNGDSH